MAIEIMNAQSKTYMSSSAGIPQTGGNGGTPDRITPPPTDTADNGVVQLFPQEKKPASEQATGSAEQVSAMVEDLQASLEMLQQKNTQLNFSVHEKTDRVMVRITDQSTGDVIREIPSEEFLDMAAKLQEMVGLMFDAKI
ncbi:MAG: flagellar protein FlaG [Desulfotignum sp.]|nr:flagellar protein FlaG [Desulfotignum sp.]MCF8088438.1 flagellar protein FlaG [Desulfotignum sp.]MCF8136439.1 flagellar protein FlaG [Desulfotignum sp.]